MKNEIMDIVFLLDRSGSMAGKEDDTIGGFNSYLDKMKTTNSKVTTVLFDNNYEIIQEREEISKVKYLDNKTYYTRGSTALLDAIGKTINYIDKYASKVLFIITTDGYENSSTKYNKEQIKEMIQGHSNWEFIYLGADIDTYNEASSIGIKTTRTSNYTKSKNGIKMMFDRLKDLSMSYVEEDCIEDNWNEGLEEDND